MVAFTPPNCAILEPSFGSCVPMEYVELTEHLVMHEIDFAYVQLLDKEYWT